MNPGDGDQEDDGDGQSNDGGQGGNDGGEQPQGGTSDEDESKGTGLGGDSALSDIVDISLFGKAGVILEKFGSIFGLCRRCGGKLKVIAAIIPKGREDFIFLLKHRYYSPFFFTIRLERKE